MAIARTITRWRKLPTAEYPDKVYVEFNDLSGREFESPQHCIETINREIEENPEIAKLFAIAKAIKLDPTFVSPTSVEGKTCTIDTTTGNLVRFN